MGSLLVLDEVVTGFRMAYGGAQEYYDITPNLACYGKIIGGGYPLAAVAGPREILDLANPRRAEQPRYIFFTGTLKGNAVSATAGLATLEQLRALGGYPRQHEAGRRARQGLARIFDAGGIPCQVLGDGPMFQILFAPDPVRNYRDAMAEAKGRRSRLTLELLRRGILMNPWKAYISLAHTDDDIDHLLAAVKAIIEAGLLQ